MNQPQHDTGRDLDDEIAEAIEHQYARRLLKPSTGDGAKAPSAQHDKESFQREIEQLREKAASDRIPRGRAVLACRRHRWHAAKP